MPLYIDYHQMEGDFSIDEVRGAHAADIENQLKYGVKFIQLWVNKNSKTVFCLIEAPNPEACVSCHLASHGNTPCNIQEVEEGLLDLFMGKKLLRDEHDMVLSQNGESDPASRTLLVVHIERFKLVPRSYRGLHPFIDDHSKGLVVASIGQFNGRLLENDPDYCLVGVFSSSLDAISCAQSIREILLKESKSAKGKAKTNLHLRLGINSGPPLTDSKGFFEETLINTKRQGMIAKPGQIILSSNLRNAYELNTKEPLIPEGIRILTKSEENFLKEVFDAIEHDMHPSKCNVNLLSEQLRISRSQLYRKILTLTGESPNFLLKKIRMNKAWILLRSKGENILQTALEVGYSNPSHFSKIFRERFGYLPSVLQK